MKKKLLKQNNISSFKVFIVFIIIFFLGIIIIPKLSIRLNPSKSLPSITVNYSWDKASSYVLEKEVTSILEGNFSTIKGLTKLESKSSKGKGWVMLTFDKHSNIDELRFEIATIIRQLYKRLPEKVSYPTISINKPNSDVNNQAFLSYSIYAFQSPFLIQEKVKNYIEPSIGAIPNVDKTEVFGASPKEYIISYDYQRLKKFSINEKTIINSLKKQFSKNSLGEINYKNKYITLSINSKKEFNWNIPIKKNGNRLIYLKDIVRIKEKEQEARSYFRVNGKNAITLSVYATKNANTKILAQKVATKIKRIQKRLLNEYSIVETYNSTKYLETELNKIYERTGYTVFILLIFILVISGSFNYLIMTVLSLVSNLGIAFLLYYAFKVEIQLYSLAGITISLGLIIDNSIVMIDHIKKQGNTEVFVPILASTLTTIGALAIIYFLDDKYKVNLIDFALVIIINLSVSLCVALFLIPALLEKIPIKKAKPKQRGIYISKKVYRFYTKLLQILLRFKKLVVICIVFVFGIPFFMLPQKMSNNKTTLEKIYNNTIGHEWYIENLRPTVDAYLGGSFRLFNYYVFQKATYNKNQETKLFVVANMERGATVHQMNEAFLKVENYLSQFNKVHQFTSSVYSGDYARIEITFKDEDENSMFPFTLKELLVKKTSNFNGIDWKIYGIGNGFSNNRRNIDPIKFSVKAIGYNYDVLNNWCDSLKTELKKHPRIQKVMVKENSYSTKRPLYEYRFFFDKERLAINKSNPFMFFQELKSLTLSKQSDASFNVKGKNTSVRLESNESQNFDLWAVKNSPIGGKEKRELFNNIAKTFKEKEEESIYKENQEYIRSVQFQYIGSEEGGAQFLKKVLKKQSIKLPLGYFFLNNGSRRLLKDNNNNNYILSLLLVFGVIYLICSVLFESLKQPFIILSVIPISFIGVFLTFYLFDFNFDQGGLASFVLLSGITVNASIFIINGFNKLKKEQPNENYISLYVEALKQKIFPIILTILSTIIGFIPFLKDGQNEVFWFALGAGTIGGLFFSLLGILIYLPLFTLKKETIKAL